MFRAKLKRKSVNLFYSLTNLAINRDILLVRYAKALELPIRLNKTQGEIFTLPKLTIYFDFHNLFYLWSAYLFLPKRIYDFYLRLLERATAKLLII